MIGKVKVDNIPAGSVPMYHCDEGSNPVIYKKGKLVRAKVERHTRFTIPLIKINGDTLFRIGELLSQEPKFNLDNFVLCIRNDEIGLGCSNYTK